jgi:hypothetical protein
VALLARATASQSMQSLSHSTPTQALMARGDVLAGIRNILYMKAHTATDWACNSVRIPVTPHLDTADPVAVVKVCALCVHHQPLAPLEEHCASVCDLWEAAVLTQHCILCIFSLQEVPAGRPQERNDLAE